MHVYIHDGYLTVILDVLELLGLSNPSAWPLGNWDYRCTLLCLS